MTEEKTRTRKNSFAVAKFHVTVTGPCFFPPAMDKKKALAKIAGEIDSCPLCREWGEGNPVPGEGNPGKEEAKAGRPFIGRSGKLLRSVIRDIGLDEEDVFITSPVKYLPHRGTPTMGNILHGREHLLKQLSVIEPKILVLMGNVACRAVLEKKVEVARDRGNIIRINGITCLITFHPAYALRFPSGKRAFIRDFKKLKRLISAANRQKSGSVDS
jgi:uracil-DNA glycosylase family 4